MLAEGDEVGDARYHSQQTVAEWANDRLYLIPLQAARHGGGCTSHWV